MSKRKAKVQAAAAIRDKWRAKEWYDLIAPEYFNSIELGVTPSSNKDLLKTRIVRSNMYEITDKFNLMHVNVKFAVDKVKGTKAHTEFVGHELTRDYIRSLVRRGTSRIEAVLDVYTLDEHLVRVTVITFTHSRIRTSLQKVVRKASIKKVSETISKLTYVDFAKKVVRGDIARSVEKTLTEILPIRKTEILKSKLKMKPKRKKKVEKPVDAAE
ncbi:MAG: 30S ribosomal protein S3ae [Candidatus Ranarchaeia archaeon]